MGKFITLREEFESETGAHAFADQQYIEWLEKVVERQRQVKNCNLGVVSGSADINADKAHYDALLDCCNKILDSVDAGKVPQKEIMGLRILLNR